MESFAFAFNALAPLVFLALLGYYLRQKRVLSDNFVSHLNRFIFVVALPVLIFMTLADVEGLEHISWGVVWFSVAMVFFIVFFGTLAVLVWRGDAKYKPVVLQSFYRGNFVLIGVPLAIRLGGSEHLSVVMILNVFLIPLTNTLSILTFNLFQKTERFSKKMLLNFIADTFKNPLMIAVIFGILAIVFETPWAAIKDNAGVVVETLDYIAVTATPMALIAVGGQFKVTRSRALMRPLLFGGIGRLVVVPTIVFTMAILLRPWIAFDHAWAALISIFASPVAVSSVAVTKGLGGDDELASQLVLWTTAAAVFTIFSIVVLFRFVGFL